MNDIINHLIEEIQNVPDSDRIDPRIGLFRLRENCITALQTLSPDIIFSTSHQELQSTIWVIDQITSTESSFDRWLLFVLRSKKTACAKALKNCLVRENGLLAA